MLPSGVPALDRDKALELLGQLEAPLLDLRDLRRRHRAACRAAIDTGMATLATFFPPSDHVGKQKSNAYKDAPRICAACPVRRQCLDAAMLEESGDGPKRQGCRGGLCPSERFRLAKRRRRKRAAVYDDDDATMLRKAG
jgi:Transcription factor WhiB